MNGFAHQRIVKLTQFDCAGQASGPDEHPLSDSNWLGITCWQYGQEHGALCGSAPAKVF